MDENEIYMIVCNRKIANELMEGNSDLTDDNFILTNILPDNKVVVVSEADFMEWLDGKEDDK